MEDLEQLLALLQAYGVTAYADKEYKLELTHLAPSEVYSDDDSFEIMMDKLHVTEDTN